MELHFWLIPIMAMLAVGVVVFYLVVSRSGGSGVRTEGRTLVDKPVEKVETKAEWNFYGKP